MRTLTRLCTASEVASRYNKCQQNIRKEEENSIRDRIRSKQYHVGRKDLTMICHDRVMAQILYVHASADSDMFGTKAK